MIELKENNLTHETVSQLWQNCHATWFTDTCADFSAVNNCDSSAVAFIVKWAKKCQERNQKLICKNVPAQLRELIQIYKATSLIEFE